VQILTLPPYSPELNPTEQLWDLIRVRRFSNQIYASLDDVEHALVAELRALENQPATIAKLTARAWITQATNMNAT
jgi:transposase